MRYTIPCFLLILFGCVASDPIVNLQSAEDFTLYSIDGREIERDKETLATETFRGYPVLGKLKIDDADSRRKLIAAFNDARARKPQHGAKCFIPRHGIRATLNGKTIEYVICFECSRFSEYVNGTAVRVEELLNKDVQPVFDRPLKDAGISIAPK